MDRDFYPADQPSAHDLAKSVSATMEDATILRQENSTWRRMWGLAMRRGWIPKDDRACFSPEDIHLAMPASLEYDDFGNCRGKLES